MRSEINDLVAMRDVETLYELMTEDDDWMTQLDAAEGLVKLGDRRGFEFIMTATLSDDESILEVAQEILESPEMQRMRRFARYWDLVANSGNFVPGPQTFVPERAQLPNLKLAQCLWMGVDALVLETDDSLQVDGWGLRFGIPLEREGWQLGVLYAGNRTTSSVAPLSSGWLAGSITTSQTAEIAEMRSLLQGG